LKYAISRFRIFYYYLSNFYKLKSRVLKTIHSVKRIEIYTDIDQINKKSHFFLLHKNNIQLVKEENTIAYHIQLVCVICKIRSLCTTHLWNESIK
jgi:hypothetical protein